MTSIGPARSPSGTDRPPSGTGPFRPVVPMLGVAAAVVYAWWATGQLPFTAAATVAVGIPVAGLVALAVVRRPTGTGGREPLRPGAVLPWAGLLAAAVVLEIVGLALGGRASGVPTLSTVVDHALTWHASRWALFCAWLAAGAAPLVSPVLHRRDGVA